jgi:hypothetical protein
MTRWVFFNWHRKSWLIGSRATEANRSVMTGKKGSDIINEDVRNIAVMDVVAEVKAAYMV